MKRTVAVKGHVRKLPAKKPKIAGYRGPWQGLSGGLDTNQQMMWTGITIFPATTGQRKLSQGYYPNQSTQQRKSDIPLQNGMLNIPASPKKTWKNTPWP